MRFADYRCKIEDSYEDAGQFYKVTGRDVFTNRLVVVKIPAAELFAYRQGKLIQDAMPSLTAQEREFLISGMWDGAEEPEPGDMECDNPACGCH
jgi:hypothetical protein